MVIEGDKFGYIYLLDTIIMKSHSGLCEIKLKMPIFSVINCYQN